MNDFGKEKSRRLINSVAGDDLSHNFSSFSPTEFEHSRLRRHSLDGRNVPEISVPVLPPISSLLSGGRKSLQISEGESSKSPTRKRAFQEARNASLNSEQGPIARDESRFLEFRRASLLFLFIHLLSSIKFDPITYTNQLSSFGTVSSEHNLTSHLLTDATTSLSIPIQPPK